MPRFIVAWLTILLAGVPAFAQERYATLIENTAEATIEDSPTTVEFQLRKSFSGDTLADAAGSAQAFAPGLRKALKDAGYERAALTITGPMIPEANQTNIVLRATIRVGIGSTGAEGSRSIAFAAAADAIAAMAKKLESDLKGPILDVPNRSDIEKQAVQRAIEYAYERAEAAAEVMRINIVSVDHAQIEEVIWHDRPKEDDHREASAERISVTARVKVTYLAMPPP